MNKYYFAIDPKNYKGQVITSFDYETKKQHYNNGVGTTETYLKENPDHLVITDDQHYNEWYLPFMENRSESVTELRDEEQYMDLIEQLPPLRWENGCYWCLEAISGSYHTIWVSHQERYFETMGSKFDTSEKIIKRIENFINNK